MAKKKRSKATMYEFHDEALRRLNKRLEKENRELYEKDIKGGR